MNDQPHSVFVKVKLEQVHENPLQPRVIISDDALKRLADSIAQQGVVQPIVLRPHPHVSEHYQLIAGERRVRAMRLLGWKVVTALVRQIPDEKLLEMALVENIQREPLNPIEEASAYRLLMTSLDLTQEELSKRVGKDRSTVANIMRLLSLPPLLKEDLKTGRLSIGHARTLLALPRAEQQLVLRNLVCQDNLSVRETEHLVERELHLSYHPPKTTAKQDAPSQDLRLRLHYQAAERSLSQMLGTKVKVIMPACSKTNSQKKIRHGEIHLQFYSESDFNRLYSLFNKENS